MFPLSQPGNHLALLPTLGTHGSMKPEAIHKLHFEKSILRVHLENGQTLAVTTTLYPRLHCATMAERRNHRLIAKGNTPFLKKRLVSRIIYE